ncbi:hypothetical protein C8R34_1661 [Nitrosomonas sp. Nm84]|uniref:hypothetical protein n=1 Tax=Nitrosomonas sp. Nm84 TaxID=200124 RepID=UPI000D754144|nr:hypothetical protein [Nitrosomonas sp. Nm84]PXW79673.1 hypothetical protein C8R34_1661 [Nitrosomonas sp. Nm84]
MSFNSMLLAALFKPSALSMILIACLLTHSDLGAAECGILKMQKHRSSGVNVVNNYCTDDSALSLNTILQIPAGARLWLESTNVTQNSENFQIICQNKSIAPVSIKIDRAVLPWINPENNSHCNSWTNDRLECQELNSEIKTLLCAIAQIKKSPVSEMMQRKTSLTLRGLIYKKNNAPFSDGVQTGTNQWKADLEPEINLCRKVFQVDDPITINWKIRTDGKITDTSITETNIDNQFTECAIEVIKNFSFPIFEKDIPVILLFD